MANVVIGVYVGGKKKGFHAVALVRDEFMDTITNQDPAIVTDWCVEHGASVIAIDSPCGWSFGGSSRLAERELRKMGILSFNCPSKQRAESNRFYGWMLNGEKLYKCLEARDYFRLKGERSQNTVIETFPHAIMCAFEKKTVSTKPKISNRRNELQRRGYDTNMLTSIDLIDAALCALAAKEFNNGNYKCFGGSEEGLIVVPTISLK